MLWKNACMPGTWVAFWRRRAITTGRRLALLLRLQRDEQPAVIGGRVGAAGADGAVDVVDRGILAQDIDQRLLPNRHRLERGIGRSLGDAGQEAGIFLREEALGHDDVERDRAGQRRQRHHQHHRLARQHPVERPFVAAQPGIEHRARTQRSTMFGFLVGIVRLQHARAQHRRQRQRHETGHHDRDRDRHREFAEHAADDAAHQQHRNEHRDQREGDRNDGEADFARALQRRLDTAACRARYGGRCFPA